MSFNEIPDINFCPHCEEVIPEAVQFCPHCQTQLSPPAVQVEVEQYICPVCGAANPPDARSCASCCSIRKA